LEGSIDIHIHSAPDVYPRLLNDVELALSAKENGMRAILVKNHYSETAGRARLASDVAGFPVFGGIALNLTSGGMNKHAVRMALKMGAKEVWMPTVHADYFVKNKSHVANLATEIGAGVQGLVLIKEDGTLKDELYEIFDIIKEADAILATGHITKEEAKLTVREAAQQMGIYIKEALMSGLSAKDVRKMVADNPAKILGI
jgi:deoxyribose-phosphate aldolase